MKYVLDRAKEAGTWRWFLILATMLGAKIAPDMQDAIVTVGVGAAGAIGVLFPDAKKV